MSMLSRLAVKAAKEAAERETARAAKPVAKSMAAKAAPAVTDLRVEMPAVQKPARPKAPARVASAKGPVEANPNFVKWFGGSKVITPEGSPRVVYHGTASKFDAFGDPHIGVGDPGFLGRGFYFADNPYVARTYAQLRPGPDERVIDAYLALHNPFDWGAKGLGVRGFVQEGTRLPDDIHDEITRMTGVSGRVPFDDRAFAERDVALAIRELLEGRGYDGVIATDDFTPDPIEFVAFKPTQIKSATGNIGSFSPTDPNLRKARGGLAVKRRKRK